MERTSKILIVCLFALTSCLDYLDTSKIGALTINPSLAIPIINSSFGFTELLASTDSITSIETDSDGLISIVYDSGPLFTGNLSSYINIQDESTSESITFSNQELASLPIDLQVTKTDRFVIDLEADEGDQIDSVFLISGNLTLDLISNFPTSGRIVFRFISLTRANQMVERTFEWSYSGSLPSLDLHEIVDLSG